MLEGIWVGGFAGAGWCLSVIEVFEKSFVVEDDVFDTEFGSDGGVEVVFCDCAGAWVSVDDDFVECG